MSHKQGREGEFLQEVNTNQTLSEPLRSGATPAELWRVTVVCVCVGGRQRQRGNEKENVIEEERESGLTFTVYPSASLDVFCSLNHEFPVS